MTIEVQTPRVQYQGDGSQDRFTYAFTVDLGSDLIVDVDQTEQVEYTDYTLENVTEAGGDVVFPVPPADLTTITIYRRTPLDQQIDLAPFDAFPADTLEWGLDKYIRIFQEIAGGVVVPGTGSVLSVFGRIGNIIAVAGDYNAEQVTYENAFSGLVSVDVQNAIDEMVSDATSPFVKRDGSTPLTANWDAGDYNITSQTFTADTSLTTQVVIGSSFTSRLELIDNSDRNTEVFVKSNGIEFYNQSESILGFTRSDPIFDGSWTFRKQVNFLEDVFVTGQLGAYSVPDHIEDQGIHLSTEISNPTEGEGLWYDADTSKWRNRNNTLETWPTGLIEGGELNIGPGANDIEVIAGQGLIVNAYSSPNSPPTAKYVTWPQINTPITAAPSAPGSIAWFSIAATITPAGDIGGVPVFEGELKQYATPLSPTVRKDEVFLGIAIYNGGWTEVSNPQVVNQSAETLREYLTNVVALTRYIQGGATTSQAGFTINLDEGVVWENNRNFHNDPSDPNRETVPAATPITFNYVDQTFGYVGPATTVIDPSIYDAGTAPDSVPGAANTATIQRLYQDPANNRWVLLGQNTYPNFLTAQASIEADNANTIVPYLLQNSILLGYAVCEKAKNDWDTDEAVWLPVGTGGVGGGGGGTPITEHNNLNLRDSANAHPITAIENFQAITAEELNDGMYWNGVAWEKGRRTKAIEGGFVQGNTYFKGDEVSDGSNISECLLDGTTSSPYVAPSGTPEYVFDGTIAVTTQSAKQVYFGNRYASATEPFYVTGYRIYTTIGNRYRVIYIKDPTGVPVFEEVLTFIASETGWRVFVIDPLAFSAGVTFDMVALTTEPDPSAVEVIASYNYLTPQNPVTPAAGEIQHGRGSPDQMRISYTDDDLTDRTALIQGLSIGDTITDGNINWTVQSNTDNTTWALITVTPATNSTAGTKDFTFGTTTATPIEIPADNNYWSGSAYPAIQGIIGVDVAYEGVTLNDNAYGIDLLVQGAYIPPANEWLLKVIASAGGSASSAVFVESGTWTPALSDGTNFATLSTAVGNYTKIGELVTCRGTIIATSKGALSGALSITGLPYMSNSTANYNAVLNIGLVTGLQITTGQSINGYMTPNANSAGLRLWDSVGGNSTLQASEIRDTVRIVFDVSYTV